MSTVEGSGFTTKLVVFSCLVLLWVFFLSLVGRSGCLFALWFLFWLGFNIARKYFAKGSN